MSGKEKLSLLFWGYYISGQLGLALLVGTLLTYIPIGTAQIALSAILVLPYMIWANWSVWACAYNVEQKYWDHAARVVVVITVMSAIRSSSEILGWF
ncbi:MAG: hypothetical protein JAY65_07600 [Candidatus Thiodiazotropha endolucinida]|nr:hypothetical protein [Candidatus Thiodiazotropha taylori]